MRVYLASPASQLQADYLRGLPVLLSYACCPKWLDRWHPSFDRILIDSGAYTAMTQGKKVDAVKYLDWAGKFDGRADAVAGLDDIEGDWRASLRNYSHGGFPTIHDTDPPELLGELIPMARERGGWLGIGLKPPRQNKERFIRWACDQIPEDIHVHGWALRAYAHIGRLDSVDSTNWFRDAMDYRAAFPWLTYGETLELVIKRYQRETRVVRDDGPCLFTDPSNG